MASGTSFIIRNHTKETSPLFQARRVSEYANPDTIDEAALSCRVLWSRFSKPFLSFYVPDVSGATPKRQIVLAGNKTLAMLCHLAKRALPLVRRYGRALNYYTSNVPLATPSRLLEVEPARRHRRKQPTSASNHPEPAVDHLDHHHSDHQEEVRQLLPADLTRLSWILGSRGMGGGSARVYTHSGFN